MEQQHAHKDGLVTSHRTPTRQFVQHSRVLPVSLGRMDETIKIFKEGLVALNEESAEMRASLLGGMADINFKKSYFDKAIVLRRCS